MASILKAQKVNESKRKGKRKADDLDGDVSMLEGGEEGEGQVVKKVKRNKQRVLLLSSRGITHRMRHLMNDLEAFEGCVWRLTWKLRNHILLSSRENVRMWSMNGLALRA